MLKFPQYWAVVVENEIRVVDFRRVAPFDEVKS